jgi:hypothetical protein
MRTGEVTRGRRRAVNTDKIEERIREREREF